MLLEDQHKPASSGVTAACLCKKTGHVAIVNPSVVTFFDPLLLEVSATMAIPAPPDGVRNAKLQASSCGTVLFLGRTDGVVLKSARRHCALFVLSAPRAVATPIPHSTPVPPTPHLTPTTPPCRFRLRASQFRSRICPSPT